MDTETLVGHIRRLEAGLAGAGTGRFPPGSSGECAKAREFLRTYAGPASEFYLVAKRLQSAAPGVQAEILLSVLQNFRGYLESGLVEGVSPKRQAELDLVSDLLAQAQRLLADKKVHPAAPVMLIGATLEEFLRTWVEAEDLSLGNRKPSIDAYVGLLRKASLITKQDVKDITAWAGARNHAAHGEWDEVADRKRANLLLEGVNLFMRKYTP